MKETKLSDLDIVPEEFDVEHYYKIDYTSIHSEMDDSERRFISGLIRYYKPSHIVEVGVSRGGGTVNILNAISDFDSRCISLDISDTWYGGNEPIACDVDLKCIGVGSDKWELITNTDPVDVVEKIDKMFDFAVIDTMHMHPVESLNFLTLLPFLNDGAIVCLHDTIDFCSKVNCHYANRILMMCVCAEKIEPRSAGYIAIKGMDLPNIVAFQVTQDTRRYIRGVFDSFIFPWEMIPNRMEFLSRFLSRHYSEELCSIFQCAIEFQKKYRFIDMIGGIVLSIPPIFVTFTSWKDLGGKIIFYGAGNEMKNLLVGSEAYGLSFDFKIWDVNAAKIGSINGQKVELPDFDKKADAGTKLCVMIKDLYIFKQVQCQMSPLGYEVFHGIRALVDSVRAEYTAMHREDSE